MPAIKSFTDAPMCVATALIQFSSVQFTLHHTHVFPFDTRQFIDSYYRGCFCLRCQCHRHRIIDIGNDVAVLWIRCYNHQQTQQWITNDNHIIHWISLNIDTFNMCAHMWMVRVCLCVYRPNTLRLYTVFEIVDLSKLRMYLHLIYMQWLRNI